MSGSNYSTISSSKEKYAIALMGAVAPIVGKRLTRDSELAMAQLWGSYLEAAVLLFILGAIVCYLSAERQRMKLFALAISAPAFIANLSADTTPDTSIFGDPGPGMAEETFWFEFPGLVSTAVAADGASSRQYASVLNGLQRFFGKEPSAHATSQGGVPKYWVIAFSSDNEQLAKEVAAAINSKAPHLNAFVGVRRPGQQEYPVIVGNYVPLDSAKGLLAEVSNVKRQVPALTSTAVLDDYPNRR